VVINSPGNPVGNIVTPDEMREIYEIVDRQAYVLNDEIYNNTMFYDEFHSPLALFPEHKDMTIVTNSFSKGFRMYTKRIGFAILPTDLQTNLRVIQQHTLLCTDPCYQYGMIAALADEESPRELTGVYKARAEYTTKRLTGTRCTPTTRCCVAKTGTRRWALPLPRSSPGTSLKKPMLPSCRAPTSAFRKTCGWPFATIGMKRGLTGYTIISPPRTRPLRRGRRPYPDHFRS